MSRFRRVLAVSACVFVALVVVASLTLMESPGAARLVKADEARVQDLEALQSAVRNYYGSSGVLPDSLEVLLENRWIEPERLRDPVTGLPYSYQILDPSHFELCAEFARDAAARGRGGRIPGPRGEANLWAHRAGRDCFRFPGPWKE